MSATVKIVSVLAGLLLLAIGFVAGQMHTQPACPVGKVCLDPMAVSCFLTDMTIARWRPVQKEGRGPISALVYRGRAEYKLQQQGVDCYERDEHFALGDKVSTFPVEWWKPL